MKGKRFLKGCATLGGLLALGGFVCCLVGLAMGGSVDYLRFGPGGWGYDRPLVSAEGSAEAPTLEDRGDAVYNDHSGHAEVSFDEAEAVYTLDDLGGDFSSLEVDLGLAELEILPGDEFLLTISGDGPACRVYLEDAALHLEMEDEDLPTDLDLSRLGGRTLSLTLPDGMTLDEIDLEIGAGTLLAEGLTCRKLEAEVGMGEMELIGLICDGEASLTAGMGELTVTDFACAGRAGLEVNMGSLTLDGHLDGYTEIDCGMGSAELTLDDPGSYGYTAECGMGSIAIGGDTVSTGTITRGTPSEPVYYDIECGMGSVTIEFS